MASRNFFAELRRRNVYKVAVAYAVVAWLLIQAASILFPTFEAPAWVMKGVVVILVLGFPAALVLSWAFEITPEGIKRAEDVTPNESIAKRAGRKIVGLTVALAVMAAGLLVFQYLRPKATSEDKGRSAASQPIPEKSIAVLPFENLSEEKSNAYFVDGIQDEILTRLAKISALRVTSRTSTRRYASRPDNLREIAKQLGVAHALEGSVQRVGGKVRINLQLIDARSDRSLWAQNYDRDLKDVFAVQSDVAEKVAEALKAKLLPAEAARLASVPTQNPEAYDLYLRANAHLNRGNDQPVLVARVMPLAIALYQQALAEDPGFALAAAAQAQAHMLMYWFAPDHSTTRLAAAKAAADQALTLQPDLGEGHLALGLYWYWGHRDYAQALQQLELARKSLPNSEYVELYLGAIARRQGRWNDAIARYKRSILLNPRSSLSVDELAMAYMSLRRYADSDQTFALAVAVAQDPTDEQITQAFNTVVWKGDLAPLRAAIRSLTPGSDNYAGNGLALFRFAWWSRDNAAAVQVAETNAAANWRELSNIILPRRLYLAWAYQAAGDNAKAQPEYVELRTQLKVALQQHPDDANLRLALGFAAAGLGLKDEAVREARNATTLIPVSRDSYSGPYYLASLAQLYVRVGENNQAIDLLQQLLAMPSGGGAISPALLKLDPVWDPLRKDPRFEKLISDGEAARAQTKP